MKLLKKLMLLAVFATTLVSCSDDDDVIQNSQVEPNIAEIVSEDSEYSSLLAALEATNLVADFTTNTELTVFAPNNAAFDAFLQANNFSSLEDVPTDLLRDVLLNHVVEGTNLAADLSTGYINSFAVGASSEENLSLFVNTTDGVEINGVATVIQADIEASNGVIHAVDHVIGLPNIATHALANPEFSTLVAALQYASNSETNYVDILSGEESSPFTVFAPTNAAFDDLLSALGVASLNDLDPATVGLILEYHVIAGSNVRSEDITNGLEAMTFEGGQIEFDLTNGSQIMDASNRNSNIAVVDVQTNNGVIHAVDKVLLPQAAVDVISNNITGLAYLTGDLSNLFEALKLTGLDEVLSNSEGEYTVFAPTNTAFTTFLGGAALDGLSVETLTQVLLNHVLEGENLSTSLSTTYTNSLATYGDTENNISFYINTDDGVVLNGESTVVTPDIEAANGVVHVVDAVIGLPTVVTFATADPNLSTLVSALTAEGQPDFVTTLSTQGDAPAPFTVFAPTNQAFTDLLNELGVNSLDDIETETLTGALNTHVIGEANVRSTDLTDGTVSTLGADLSVDVANSTLTDPNDRVSNIIDVDIQTANGVIHVIDTVLLPQL